MQHFIKCKMIRG